MLSIRAMNRLDSAHVLRINWSGQPGIAPLDEGELSRLMAVPNEHLTAARGDDVVGYLLAFRGDAIYDGEEFLAFQRILTQPFIYVDQVAVSISAQRSGIGKSLYKELEVSARAQGIGLLCSEVNISPRNEPSLAFHASLEFSPMGPLSTSDGREVELFKKRC
jgi:uncharacterized protein